MGLGCSFPTGKSLFGLWWATYLSELSTVCRQCPSSLISLYLGLGPSSFNQNNAINLTRVLFTPHADMVPVTFWLKNGYIKFGYPFVYLLVYTMPHSLSINIQQMCEKLQWASWEQQENDGLYQGCSSTVASVAILQAADAWGLLSSPVLCLEISSIINGSTA